jgi:hypothetical protein
LPLRWLGPGPRSRRGLRTNAQPAYLNLRILELAARVLRDAGKSPGAWERVHIVLTALPRPIVLVVLANHKRTFHALNSLGALRNGNRVINRVLAARTAAEPYHSVRISVDVDSAEARDVISR